MSHDIVIFEASYENRKRRTKKSLQFTSNFLLLFVLISGLFIFGPILAKNLELKLAGKNPASQVKFGDLLGQTTLVNLTAPDPQFSLVIPKINVRAKIVANVDPANTREYQAVLKENVAHAKGTALPGMDGTVYLFGHSSQFPSGAIDGAVFALLDKVAPGDQIIVYFAGVRYVYAVTEKKILEVSDLQYYHEKTSEARLILQTCWPPGTSKWQLVVFARPVYLLTDVYFPDILNL